MSIVRAYASAMRQNAMAMLAHNDSCIRVMHGQFCINAPWAAERVSSN
jgi:hypothetical protein